MREYKIPPISYFAFGHNLLYQYISISMSYNLRVELALNLFPEFQLYVTNNKFSHKGNFSKLISM